MAKLLKENIRKPYVQKVMTITKRNIKDFIRPEWHREFRESHITKIRNAMLRGEHPSENLTINQEGRRMRIINGNHRTEAIRRIINDYSDFTIEMTLTIYYNLTKEEEIAIYEKVNNVKAETGLDRLKAHITGTELMDILEKKLPFRVVFRQPQKTERNVMSAGTVILAYMNRSSISGGGGTKIAIQNLGNLTDNDYDRIIEYAKFFKRVFGEPGKDNMYSSYNIYSVVAKLYYSLAGVDIKEDDLENELKKVMMRNTGELMLFNKGVHRQKDLYRFLFDKIKGRRKLFNLLSGVKE